jgi:CubicO group peptidase (beta-lactamase class C family)
VLLSTAPRSTRCCRTRSTPAPFPHVAAIAADRDGLVYEGAAGVRITGESDDPVTTSTQFQIMSMTKMVATVAAPQQVERGALDLDAPVDAYCPDFADVQVLEGFDGDTPRLRAPASRAMVRHLVTYTSGLGYWFWNADSIQGPAGGRPSTRFVYGINTDWLTRNEVASRVRSRSPTYLRRSCARLPDQTLTCLPGSADGGSTWIDGFA